MTATAMAAMGRAGAPTVIARARRVADGDVEPSLREEIRLVLSISFAVIAIFGPAAALVVGVGSIDLLAWLSILCLNWVGSVGAQVVALRSTRRAWGRRRGRLAGQFAVAAAVGAALHMTVVNALISPWSQRLGLIGDEQFSLAAVLTSILAAAYLVWERELRSRQRRADRRLASIQQAQLAARRSVVDAQLRAVQARIDPPFFFVTLDAIESLYRSDIRRAEAAFEELITFLRAALPTVDGRSTVLARELDLAAACVRIHALTGRDGCALHVDIAESLRRRPFPAGILLPLVRGALEAAKDPVELRVSVGADKSGVAPSFTLTIAAPAAPGNDVFATVRESLCALFGTSATLVCASRLAGVDITLALPREEG
ncbi:MAG: histidine kinase [Caldimonas sp.]